MDSTTFLLPAGDGPVRLDDATNKEPGDGPTNKITAAATLVTTTTTTTATTNVIKKKQQNIINCSNSSSESPKATTAKIFAPRTEDMNKGFLTFSDDDTGLTSEYFI